MPSSAWTFGTEPVAAATAVERTRPRYSAEDLATLLWRQRLLMAVVFVAILAVAALGVVRLKTTYPATSSLLIRLGQAYVYNPAIGDAARGTAPQTDEVVQSEVEILGSAALKDRVIRDIGLARLFPDLGRDYARASLDQRKAIEGAAIKNLEAGLKITTAPDNAVVRLSYSHPDPQVAALVLNTLVDEYLVYRRQVLIARDAGPLGDERRSFERRLADVDADYTKFLKDNGIGDFEAERTSLGQLYGQLLGDSYSVQAQLSETEGRLGVAARQAAATPSEIGLYRDLDHTASDKLAALKVELQDLQARYQPTSQPVRDKEAQVAAMEKLAAAQTNVVGQQRVGVNPVFQTAVTERNTLQAQVASLRARKAADDAEIARVLARRQKLAAIEPEYQELTRQRDLLSTNVRNFAQREQDSQAASALAARGDDSVRVIQRAYVPTRGTSLKKPALLAAAAFAAFSAACAGLLGAFLSRSYPSAGAAERTLELPVLVSAARKPRAA